MFLGLKWKRTQNGSFDWALYYYLNNIVMLLFIQVYSLRYLTGFIFYFNCLWMQEMTFVVAISWTSLSRNKKSLDIFLCRASLLLI